MVDVSADPHPHLYIRNCKKDLGEMPRPCRNFQTSPDIWFSLPPDGNVFVRIHNSGNVDATNVILDIRIKRQKAANRTLKTIGTALVPRVPRNSATIVSVPVQDFKFKGRRVYAKALDTYSMTHDPGRAAKWRVKRNSLVAGVLKVLHRKPGWVRRYLAALP